MSTARSRCTTAVVIVGLITSAAVGGSMATPTHLLALPGASANAAVRVLAGDVTIIDSEVIMPDLRSGVVVNAGTARIDSAYFEGHGNPVYALTGGSISIDHSVMEDSLNAVVIGDGSVTVDNSTLGGNAGVFFDPIPLGSATAVVRTSNWGPALFVGNSSGPRTLVVHNSNLGSGVVATSTAFTSVELRHVTLDAGATVTAATESCTATAVGAIFLDTGCP